MNLRERLTGWLDPPSSGTASSGTPPAPTPGAAGAGAPVATPPNEPGDNLDKIALVLAGGFTVLTGVLTFVGVKDGVLARILRNSPRPALLVFTLVGLAVGCGVIAPAVKGKVRIGLIVVLMVLTGIWLTVELPRFDGGVSGQLPGWLFVLLVLLLLVALLWTWSKETSQKAGLIALGLGFFAFGLFGAFKLAVIEKGDKDRPRLTAAFTTAESRTVLRVTVNAVGLRVNEHVAVTVDAFPEQPPDCAYDKTRCSLLYGSRTGADELGKVDTTIDVPVPVGTYRHFRVLAFICEAARTEGPVIDAQKASPTDDCVPTAAKTAMSDVIAPLPPVRPTLAAVIKSTDAMGSVIDVTASLESFAAGRALNAWVVSTTDAGESRVVARGRIGPTAGGAASMTIPVHVPANIRRICVAAVSGDPVTDERCVATGERSILELPVPIDP